MVRQILIKQRVAWILMGKEVIEYQQIIAEYMIGCHQTSGVRMGEGINVDIVNGVEKPEKSCGIEAVSAGDKQGPWVLTFLREAGCRW